MDITISGIFKAILHKWYILVVAVVLVGSSGMLISSVAIKKEYESFSQYLIFVTKDSPNANVMSESAATSHCIAQSTSSELFFELSTALENKGVGKFNKMQLEQAVVMKVYEKGLNLVNVTCKFGTAEKAQEILKVFNEIFVAKMASLPFDGQHINVVVSESPSFKPSPTSPNVLLNTAIALVVGFVAGVVMILIMAFGNSKMKNIGNIENELNVAVLGEIPLFTADDELLEKAEGAKK
ncbi:MAG: hypothetical protein RR416_05325 [Clostridia bacterium]